MGEYSFISVLVSQVFNPNTFKLIAATADYKNSNIVDWLSNNMRKKIEDIIRNVYGYFFKILIGLKDKPIKVQNHWRAVLVNFLQKTRVELPPLASY